MEYRRKNTSSLHQMEHSHVHPFEPNMLSVEQAQKQIVGTIKILESVELPLMECLGQSLAESVRSELNIPSARNSAMDGYAVRLSDIEAYPSKLPIRMPVSAQLQAGQVPFSTLRKGTAVRIMTGAPVPDGADAIVPFEMTNEAEQLRNGASLDEIELRAKPNLGDHIRNAGEDVKKGKLVLRKGHVLNPASLGMLASLGHQNVKVIRRPVVAVLSTGDEVTEPGLPLSPGHLYDSNSYTVGSSIHHYGGIPLNLGIARDNMHDLRNKLQIGKDVDMLITTAGVSGGAYDMVKEALSEQGKMSFWSVRMRPGKPLAFGFLNTLDGRKIPHLGLPGNPVSTLVAMAEFVRLAIRKMMGLSLIGLPEVEAVLDDPIYNPDGRRVYARVTLSKREGKLHAQLAGSQGSNVLTSMVHAQGLAICPEDIKVKQPGEIATVQLLNWNDISPNIL